GRILIAALSATGVCCAGRVRRAEARQPRAVIPRRAGPGLSSDPSLRSDDREGLRMTAKDQMTARGNDPIFHFVHDDNPGGIPVSSLILGSVKESDKSLESPPVPPSDGVPRRPRRGEPA